MDKSRIFTIGKTLYLFGDINRYSNIRMTKEMSAKGIHRIIINSDGGFVDYALSMGDFLSHYPKEVDIVVSGTAKSSATLLLAAATGRKYMTPNSYLMYHKCYQNNSFSQHINIHDAVKVANELNFVETQINNYLRSKSPMTAEFYLSRVSEKDIYLNASEALRYGLIDGIVE